MDDVYAYAKLNAKIMPLDRGDRFEDPLAEMLEESGFGQVGGGGTLQSKEGEIIYCGIDIDFTDVEQGAPLVCQFLTERGAPRGSELDYEIDGKKFTIPFGEVQGLGIYLNGTDLPEEVYRDSDVNEVVDEINRLLSGRGAIEGHWQGPTETALYLYGVSVEEMRNLIAPLMDSHPLCQRARLVTIA